MATARAWPLSDAVVVAFAVPGAVALAAMPVTGRLPLRGPELAVEGG